jgi:hypothetical protein
MVTYAAEDELFELFEVELAVKHELPPLFGPCY